MLGLVRHLFTVGVHYDGNEPWDSAQHCSGQVICVDPVQDTC